MFGPRTNRPGIASSLRTTILRTFNIIRLYCFMLQTELSEIIQFRSPSVLRRRRLNLEALLRAEIKS